MGRCPRRVHFPAAARARSSRQGASSPIVRRGGALAWLAVLLAGSLSWQAPASGVGVTRPGCCLLEPGAALSPAPFIPSRRTAPSPRLVSFPSPSGHRLRLRAAGGRSDAKGGALQGLRWPAGRPARGQGWQGWRGRADPCASSRRRVLCPPALHPPFRPSGRLQGMCDRCLAPGTGGCGKGCGSMRAGQQHRCRLAPDSACRRHPPASLSPLLLLTGALDCSAHLTAQQRPRARPLPFVKALLPAASVRRRAGQRATRGSMPPALAFPIAAAAAAVAADAAHGCCCSPSSLCWRSC